METSWKTRAHSKPVTRSCMVRGEEQRGLGFLANRRKKQMLCKSAVYKSVILCSYRMGLVLGLIITRCQPGTSSSLVLSPAEATGRVLWAPSSPVALRSHLQPLLLQPGAARLLPTAEEPAGALLKGSSDWAARPRTRSAAGAPPAAMLSNLLR